MSVSRFFLSILKLIINWRNCKNQKHNIETILICVSPDSSQDVEKNNQLLMGLFSGVLGLHDIYHISVAMEDMDK